jgi:hypothetical protein
MFAPPQAEGHRSRRISKGDRVSDRFGRLRR